MPALMRVLSSDSDRHTRTGPYKMPAANKKGGKKRAAAAKATEPSATDESATATDGVEEEQQQEEQEQQPAAKKAKTKKSKKPEVEFVTERDVLPAKPALPSGKAFRILSYNVNGLKAMLSKDSTHLSALVTQENADMLLLQETKLQECFVPDYSDIVPGYFGWWSCSKTKKGYAGTATFIKACYVEGTALGASATATAGAKENGGKQQSLKAFFGKKEGEAKVAAAASVAAAGAAAGGAAAAGADGVKVLGVTYGINGDGDDDEGRVITVELPFCYVVNTYVPNSGMKLERLSYRLTHANPRLQAYLQHLKATKPVILAGDLNLAHLDLDIYNCGAKHLPKVPGCTPQERAAQTTWLAEHGWVDAFRHLHPTARGAYTYWNVKTAARADNRGLRLDYFCLPAEDVDGQRGIVRVHDCGILHDGVAALSDHCPISLTLEVLDN